MTPAEARDAFTRFLKTPEAEMDLAEGALLIAAEEYPELRLGAYLDRIERLAGELREVVGDEISPGHGGTMARTDCGPLLLPVPGFCPAT